jgi:hypothetical protein
VFVIEIRQSAHDDVITALLPLSYDMVRFFFLPFVIISGQLALPANATGRGISKRGCQLKSSGAIAVSCIRPDPLFPAS